MSDTQTPASSGDEPYDKETQFEESQQIVTNDAVAEAEPSLAENDLDDQDVDLDETE
jgi:hypothetical protein